MDQAHHLTLMFRAGAALGEVIADLEGALERFYLKANAIPGEDPAIDAAVAELRDTLGMWRASLDACTVDLDQIDAAYLPDDLDDAGRAALVLEAVRGGIDRARTAFAELHVTRRDFYRLPVWAEIQALKLPDAAEYELLDYYRSNERDRRLGQAFMELELAERALSHAAPSLGI